MPDCLQPIAIYPYECVHIIDRGGKCRCCCCWFVAAHIVPRARSFCALLPGSLCRSGRRDLSRVNAWEKDCNFEILSRVISYLNRESRFGRLGLWRNVYYSGLRSGKLSTNLAKSLCWGHKWRNLFMGWDGAYFFVSPNISFPVHNSRWERKKKRISENWFVGWDTRLF